MKVPSWNSWLVLLRSSHSSVSAISQYNRPGIQMSQVSATKHLACTLGEDRLRQMINDQRQGRVCHSSTSSSGVEFIYSLHNVYDCQLFYLYQTLLHLEPGALCRPLLLVPFPASHDPFPAQHKDSFLLSYSTSRHFSCLSSAPGFRLTIGLSPGSS